MKKIKILASLAVLASIAGATIINSGSASAVVNFENGATTSLTFTRTINDIPSTTTSVSNTFTYEVLTNNNDGYYTTPTGSQSCTFNNVAVSNGTATQTCTIDLSGASFTDGTTGVKYIRIRETGSSNSTRYPVDEENEYYIPILVRRNHTDNQGNIISGGAYAEIGPFIYTDSGYEEKAQAIAFESDIFIEKTDIELTKMVKGDLGNTQEQFTFVINVIDDTNGTYNVTNPNGNPWTCTFNTNCTITLMHNQTAVIGYNGTAMQLTPGQTYTITETGAMDYNTYINGSSTDSKVLSQQTILENNNGNTQNIVNYVNESSIDVDSLTGVFFNILPYLALAGASIIGVVFVKKAKQ